MVRLKHLKRVGISELLELMGGGLDPCQASPWPTLATTHCGCLDSEDGLVAVYWWRLGVHCAVALVLDLFDTLLG